MELRSILMYFAYVLVGAGTIGILVDFAALVSAQRELRRSNTPTEVDYFRQRKLMGQWVVTVLLLSISMCLLYLAK